MHELVDVAHPVPDGLEPARDIEPDEEPRDAVKEELAEVGVWDARRVDVVLGVRLGELLEDGGDLAVTVRVGRGGEAEDGRAGEGDRDAVLRAPTFESEHAW